MFHRSVPRRRLTVILSCKLKIRKNCLLSARPSEAGLSSSRFGRDRRQVSHRGWPVFCGLLAARPRFSSGYVPAERRLPRCPGRWRPGRAERRPPRRRHPPTRQAWAVGFRGRPETLWLGTRTYWDALSAGPLAVMFLRSRGPPV